MTAINRLFAVAPALAVGAIAVLAAAPLAMAADPAPNPTRGQSLFTARCSVCHTVVQGQNKPTGPSLHGVAGRAAAQAPGYRYSAALKAARITWTDDKLDGYLAGPSRLVPGTTMMIPPITTPADRRDLIAYLKAQR